MADTFTIAFLCHASCGGSTKVALELATKLSELGHRIHILSLDPIPLEVSPALTQHSVTTPPKRRRPIGDLHLSWTAEEKEALIRELLKQHGTHAFDVVHFHYAMPFAEIVLEMRARLGPHAPKTVGTLHGTDVSTQRHAICAEQRAALSFALDQMELVTTVSQTYLQLATRLFSLRTTPTVIPNFVDAKKFRPARKSRRSMTNRGVRLVHVSNFRPVKNPLAVARLFEEIHQRVDSELWLVGEGQELAMTKAYLLEAGLASHVRFFGFRNDVYRILPEADILLMPSNEESFCLAALEAMACGLPVVATQVGGLRELIQHEVNGFLFKPGDLEQGVRYVEQLGADPALYFRIRRAARRRAQAFEARRIVAQYEDQYRELLTGTNPRPARSGVPAPMTRALLAAER